MMPPELPVCFVYFSWLIKFQRLNIHLDIINLINSTFSYSQNQFFMIITSGCPKVYYILTFDINSNKKMPQTQRSHSFDKIRKGVKK